MAQSFSIPVDEWIENPFNDGILSRDEVQILAFTELMIDALYDGLIEDIKWISGTDEIMNRIELYQFDGTLQ